MAVQFVPVRGKEASIEVLDKQEGHLYFTTDTGKILMDISDDERITLGGSGASLYYALCENVIENVDNTYSLPISSLEDPKANPKEGDLIINSDGAFYKVLSIDDDNIICNRIAVSGTGGDSGDKPTGDTIKFVKTDGIETGTIFIYGQPAYITLQANNTLGNRITYMVKIINEYAGVMTTDEYQVGDTTYPNNTEVQFDLGSKMKIGTSKITITATADDCGSARRERNSIRTIEMRLNKDNSFNARRVFNIADRISVPTIPVGEGITKTLKLYADGKLVDTRENISTSGASIELVISANTLVHGSHNLRIVLSNSAETVFCELSYEIAIFDSSDNTPIIWLGDYSASIVDHDALIIPYMVYDPEDPNHAEVYYYLNDNKLASTYEVSYSSTSWAQWRVINYKVGSNALKIETTNGKAEKIFTVNVEQDSRNMDIVEGGLLVYDAEGRSNQENMSSKTTWLSTGSAKTAVEFNNFNWYNNGWITDDEGNTCLRISNGASIRIPLQVMRSQILSSGYTFEFVFNLRNVQTYSTLITTEVVGEDTDNPQVVKTVSSTEGVVIKYYNNIGLCLGTQEGFFKSASTVVSGRYAEEQKIHVSFVVEQQQVGITSTPLIYMYINGVNSSIATYNADNDNFTCKADAIEINSNFCDIDLYKVRVYQSSLSAIQVVQNMIADYADPDMYDINMNIVEYNNNIPTINYKRMCEYNVQHPDAPLMPYAIIETLDSEHTLPYVKDEVGDGIVVNTEFVNPYLDYLYENGKIDGDEYLHSCPSYKSEHGFLNVQGTSSQGYPRRNFKSKIKGSTEQYGKCVNTYTNGPKVGETFKKWFMDSNIGANAFTWKADYMESSRCHNTGFASFVSILYGKHPIKDYIKDADTTGLRTTVYGFPMMVFHKTGEDKYEFVGLYNYNLDKSCKDNFGFTYDGGSNHSWVKNELGEYKSYEEACECWEFSHNQGGRCSFRWVPFDEKLTIEGKKKGLINIIEDYEVRYHFDKDSIENAIYGDGTNSDGEDFTGKGVDYRNEYLTKKYSRINAVLEWVSSTDPSTATDVPLPEPVQYDKVSYTNDTKEYRLAKFIGEFDQHFDKEYCEVYFIMTELLLCYDSRGKNLMLATWGPKEEGGNDIWYPIFYDIDTQLGVNNSGVPYWDYYVEPTAQNIFSTPDSVLWNNLWTCFASNIMGRYNQLRNTNLTISNLNGYYNFNPEVSKSKAMYGGRPIMAINVDEYYKYIDCAIGNGYTDTAGKKAYTTSYFYCLQGTRELQRALFLRNRFNYLDSQWQQGDFSMAGSKQGIQIRYDANDIDGTSDKYMYGPDLTDTQKETLTAKGYVITDTYPANEFDTELTFNLTPYLKQYLSLYHDDTPTNKVKAEDGKSQAISLSENDVKEARAGDAAKLQQLVYVPGPAYVSSLGDVSNKYFDMLQLQNAIRIKDIVVGNDKYGYRNDALNDSSFKLDDEAIKNDGSTNPVAKRLLEKIVLSNLSSLRSGIVVSGSEKLKEFRALGTNIQSVALADGVQIETLHLPSTINVLNLIEPTSLTEVLDEKPIEYTGETVNIYNKVSITKEEYDSAETGKYFIKQNGLYTAVDRSTTEFSASTDYYIEKPIQEYKFTDKKGLYIEGLTDANDINADSLLHLNRISIIGGQMGYNSYVVVDKAVKIKQQMQKNAYLGDNYDPSLAINLENINWTPYRLVEYGEVPFKMIVLDQETYRNDGTYYTLNDEGVYEPSYGTFVVNQVYYYIPYTYVKKTDHYTFEKYDILKSDQTLVDTWKKDTLNSYIYEYDASKDLIDKAPKDLSMIDAFIASYNASSKENYFIDTAQRADGDISNKKPYMSGNIFVHNEDGDEIDELKIRNHYKVYYPDLDIFVAKAKKSYTAKFIRIETNSNGEEFETEVDILKEDPAEIKVPSCTSIEPVKLHYRFKGWALTPDATEGYGLGDKSVMGDWKTLADANPYSDEKDTYVFYAIFERIKYVLSIAMPYRPSSRQQVQDDTYYGVSLRSIYLGLVDGNAENKVDTANGHVHYFDSSSLLAERKKYSLVGYQLLPDSYSGGNANIPEMEKLYFDFNEDDILFGFEEKYDTPITSHMSVIQAVKSISVYDNIYDKYELSGGRQYYAFGSVEEQNWIATIDGIAGKFTNILTIPKQAYRGTNGLTEVKGLGTQKVESKILGNDNTKNMIKAVFFETGSTLTHLGTSVFENWTALEEIELPNTLTNIGDRAFVGCEKLTSLTIGNETHKLLADNIGTDVFTDSGLRDITIYLSNPPTDLNALFTKWGVTSDMTVSIK